jgi:hypothetical protein
VNCLGEREEIHMDSNMNFFRFSFGKNYNEKRGEEIGSYNNKAGLILEHVEAFLEHFGDGN